MIIPNIRRVRAGDLAEAQVVVPLRRLGVDVGAEAVVGDGQVEPARGPVSGGGVGDEARTRAQRLPDEQHVSGANLELFIGPVNPDKICESFSKVLLKLKQNYII